MTDIEPEFKPRLIWPIASEEAWNKEIERGLGITKDVEARINLSIKQKIELDALQEAAALKHQEDLRKKKQDRIRDLAEQRKRIIDQRRTLLLNHTGGVTNMGKKNQTEAGATKTERPLKKTGLIDSLLSADLESAYGEGAVDAIASQVVARFEGLDMKKVRGLIFSRRAVLKAQAAKTEVAA